MTIEYKEENDDSVKCFAWIKVECQNWKIFRVQKPDDRVEMIEKAHRMGHFQAATTYSLLREEFFACL